MTKKLRKQEIASKMKNARIASKLTQAQVAEKLGMTYQAISNYERGKNSIEGDVLVKLCDIYKIDPTSIFSGLYTCPVCGLLYDSSLKSDIIEHDAHHERFIAALNFYGVCYTPIECGKVKSDSYNVLNSNCDEDTKYAAALNLIKVYFSRSVSAHNYSLEHPRFETYVSMLLNQSRWIDEFGKSIYDKLVSEYGKLPGIPEGETTYMIGTSNTNQAKNISRISISSVTDAAKKIAQRYDALDQIGKGAVVAIMDYEEQRMLDSNTFYVMNIAARDGTRKKTTITKEQADEALRLLDELPETEDF